MRTALQWALSRSCFVMFLSATLGSAERMPVGLQQAARTGPLVALQITVGVYPPECGLADAPGTCARGHRARRYSLLPDCRFGATQFDQGVREWQR